MSAPYVSPSQLARTVDEIERHVGAGGWEQPPHLYALASAEELLSKEPELAQALSVDPDSPPAETLVPIEQELPDKSLEELLATITWPESVVGAALALERIVLPPGAEESAPDDADVNNWAQSHPERTDVRIVVAVLRDGPRESVLRVRGHEADEDLIRNPDFTPDLAEALASTFLADDDPSSGSE
jgi:hypothetical protein